MNLSEFRFHSLKMLNLSNKFSTYLAIIAILFVHFAQILADSSAENSTIHYNESAILPAAFLCADGKGPLLEGEERIFPCDGQCPAGFECESVKGVNDGSGICCPNLEELYKLYNAAESGEENGGGDDGGERKEREDGEEKSTTTNIGRDEQELGVNAMALLEEHYGEKIVRPRPKPRSVSPLSDPDEQSLVRSYPIEIRRSQPRWDGLSEANIWRPRAQAVRPSLVGPSKKMGGNVDASGEEFSCRRQRLELFCEDGRRRTQFVMRWYAKEGRCVTYPWGYCPGEPVASDRTLRTREECELLCTDPLDAGQDAPVVNVVRFGFGNDGEPPQISQQDGEKQQRQQKLEFLNRKHQFDGKEGGGERDEPAELAAAAPNQEVLDQQTTDGNNPVAAGVDSGAPEPVDLSALPADETPSQSSPPLHHQNGQQSGSPPSSSSAELAEFLMADQRPVPKRKRCEKVSPYRAMCAQDGMPSQFTLRWYQRGQACFAYPYGYCHGESVYAEEPIKTERECLALCVQKRDSVRGLAGLKARRRLLRRI